MIPRQIDLNDIRLLMQVIEHGSYTAASKAIGIPKSTISQRIAGLERMIGTGLLRRTSRSFSLTEAGAELLPHARAIEELARQVERCLAERGAGLQGTLRISCSNALAQFALSPLVPRFLALHDQVAINVHATNRLVDLVSEGFDMTVRGHVGPLKDSILIQRVVARTPWALVASPGWLEQRGALEHPSVLSPGEFLCFSTLGECPDYAFSRGDEDYILHVQPRMVSDDMAMLRTSAAGGGGVTCLPRYIVRGSLADGQLVPVLSEWTAQTSAISVLTPPRAQSSKLAGAFSDFLAAEMPALVRA